MAYRMIFERTGGPEVLRREDFEPGDPAAGEIRVRHTAIGVNFIDTYHRSGLYPVALPSLIGLEAAGVVEATGAGVTNVATGDRIGYFTGPIGAYASHRTMPAARALKLPPGIADDVAAAAMLKAATTEFLVERCARVTAGQTALVHAAAGGVGLLLVQWLKSVGIRVIATAGTPEKAEIARSHGADAVFGYHEVPSAVRELTGGTGVDVVFDGVGKATSASSLDSLKRRGLYISYGNASGPVDAFDLGLLARKGSLFVTRPTLFDYYASDDDFQKGTARMLGMLEGTLKVEIGQRRALSDAASVHRDLEARLTMGSTVMRP